MHSISTYFGIVILQLAFSISMQDFLEVKVLESHSEVEPIASYFPAMIQVPKIHAYVLSVVRYILLYS